MSTTPPTVEETALKVLEALAKTLGVETMTLVLDVIEGKTELEILEGLSAFAFAVVQDILLQTQMTPDRLRVELVAAYAAADAAADVAARAKFGGK